MNRFAGLASLIVRHLVPVDDDVASDILLTTIDAASNKSRSAQVAELAGLAGFGLRLRGSRATDHNRKEILLQGAGLGGAYVSAATIIAAWTEIKQTAGDELSAALIAVIVLLAISIIAPNGAVRLTAMLILSILALGLAGAVTGPVLAGILVGTVLTLCGTFARALGLPSLGLIGAGLCALAAEGLMLSLSGGGWISASTLAAVAAIGPLGLLLLGWFDPRWALAATAVWFWRLAAFDLGDLISAIEVAGQDLSPNAVIVRWLVMGTGVLLGLSISQRAVARATAL